MERVMKKCANVACGHEREVQYMMPVLIPEEGTRVHVCNKSCHTAFTIRRAVERSRDEVF